MKSKVNFLICVILIFSAHAFAQKSKTESRNETYEWSHSWIVSKPNGVSLPGILLIGDSHVERYYPVVAKELKDKFYISKITTSRSMGDPEFINQLKGLLGSFQFDVICFNNGLHGVVYTPEEYAKYLPVVYRLLKKNNPHVKIIWITTTARRVPDNLDIFDRYNNDVDRRNKSVLDFCKEKNIRVIDFSAISLAKKEYYTTDGIHFNEAGVLVQAQMIAKEIINCCSGISK